MPTTLGFDGICVNEHHQNAYGMMPIPSVMAGALVAQDEELQDRRARHALPLLNNPLRVAEEFAMLDIITGGRHRPGFVRGIGAEYHLLGANPAESHDRFHEAHDLIMQAWTQPGPFEFEGKYYHFDYVNPWPRPFQQPHPPIWIPVAGLTRDDRMGLAPGPEIHLSADLQPGAGAGALHARCIARPPSTTATRRPRRCRLGDADLLRRDRRDRRSAKRGRISSSSSTSSCACRKRCCCRRAICRSPRCRA